MPFSQIINFRQNLITIRQVDLAKWEAMKPVEEMNREEALEAGYLIQTS